jgi:protein O-GlcNAc transferase
MTQGGDAVRVSALLARAQRALDARERTRAFECCTRALRRDRRCAAAWQLRGTILMGVGEFAAAGEHFERVLELARECSAEAHHHLAQVRFQFGQVDEALAHLDQAAVARPEGDATTSLALAAAYCPGATRATLDDIRARREAVGSRLAKRAAAPVAVPRRGSTDRLRIGYVSAHFDQANYMKPVWGLVNEHDRERFQVHFLSDASSSAEAAGYRPEGRDRWHDVRGLDNAALARFVRELDLDVLVDLNGYSCLARLGLWVLRPARTAVAWFNMYATSGIPGIDYLIGDSVVYHPEEAEAFTERVLTLPGTYLAFRCAYSAPEVAPPPCLANSRFTLGCLAPQYKLTDEVLGAWAAILRRAPRSRLLLRNRVLGKDRNRAYVRARLSAAGLPLRRVVLAGPAPHRQFLRTYGRIDLTVDTFPYNGGSTTMESLWQGVPVACFTGDRWASRIGASLMHGAGLHEFVARDVADHVDRTVRFVRDPHTPARLAGLRAQLRPRLLASPVCDTPALARAVERLYRQISRPGTSSPSWPPPTA